MFFKNGNSIVHLNVGGTKFEVARSTIDKYPETMLANLVSQKWQNNPEEEVFIDRDGDAFRFVLSYMRDAEVSLPATVSKNANLRELEYYGFRNISEGAVYFDTISPVDVLRGMGQFNDKYTADVKHHEALQEDLTREKVCRDTAYQCFIQLAQQWRSTSKQNVMEVYLQSERFTMSHASAKEDLTCLRIHLETYGLVLHEMKKFSAKDVKFSLSLKRN
jgi:hypothetical protein